MWHKIHCLAPIAECRDIVGCAVAETCTNGSDQQCSKCAAGYALVDGATDTCVFPAGEPLTLSAARLTSESDNNNENVQDALPSRILKFTKKSAVSLMKLTYVDNLRVRGAETWCRWTIKIDGKDCPIPIYNSKYTSTTSGNDHTPHAISGTCSNITAGEHTMTIGLTRKADGADCYTSWTATHTTEDAFFMEAQELNPTCLLYTSPSPRD